MIYETTQPSVLIAIVLFLIIWHLYRKEKKKKKEQELKRKSLEEENKRRSEEARRRNEEARRQTEERRKRDKELDRERSAIRESGMIPVAIFITESEARLKKICEDECGTDITKEIILKAWEALYNASGDERESLANIPGERKGRKQTFYVAMDEEDANRMKYCRIVAAMEESAVYVLGLNLYKGQFTK